MLQVTLILNIDNKDEIIESPANFRRFGVTLSGSEALSALNLAVELTIPSYDKFILITQGGTVGLLVGGAVASWLVRSTQDRVVRGRVLAGDIVLCSWARHFTLTVPLSTQVYKCVPANLNLLP